MCCEKSDAQIEDSVFGCVNCEERAMSTGQAIQKKSRTILQKLSSPIGLVAGVVITVILIVLLINGGGYKRTLYKYYKAYENNDADLMYNSVTARYWIDYVNEGWGDSAYDFVQDSIEESIDDWHCGDDIKITYKIQEKRRATKEELHDLEEEIYDEYAYYVYDRERFSITDAYVLYVDFTVKGDNRTESFHYPNGLLVIKENGKWRIARGTITCSFFDNG